MGLMEEYKKDMDTSSEWTTYIEWLEERTKRIENKYENSLSALLSIYDSLKLHDNGQLFNDDETLTQIMFRKMKGYNVDLNKELNFTHLKPTKKQLH